MTFSRFAIVAVCVALLIAAAWHWLPSNASAPVAATSAAAHSQQAVAIEGIGYIEPHSELRQLVPRTSGVIRRCVTAVGQRVAAGDVLVELDDSTEQAALAVARQELALARVQAADVRAGINPFRLKTAEQMWTRLDAARKYFVEEQTRQERLFQQRTITAESLAKIRHDAQQAELQWAEQSAELDYLRHWTTPEQLAISEARVQLAETALAKAEQAVRDCLLVAPFDGTVLKYLKREGEGVQTLVPDAVALFGDLSRLRVRAEIDERFAQQVQLGAKATIHGFNLHGQSHSGQVVEIKPVMGTKTVFTRSASERKDLTVMEVLIELDNSVTTPIGLQVDVRIGAR